MINYPEPNLNFFRTQRIFAKNTQKQAMSSSTSSNLWLIGAGQMARDYVQVLKALETPFKVIPKARIYPWPFRSPFGHGNLGI